MAKKGLGARIDTITRAQERLEIKKAILLKNAIESENPTDIIKANQLLSQTAGKSDKKSYLIDPNEFMNSFGFKDKPTPLSYDMLRGMSRTSIVNAIIRTRINQVAAFAEPQSDKYSVGYEIRKKRKITEPDEPEDLSNTEKREIDEIYEFLENGGQESGGWSFDDLDTFMRKITRDSLTFDQMTFEIVRTKGNKLFEFFATDASTFRISDSYIDDEYKERGKVAKNGYYPSYVQVYQNSVTEEYYPWELCFGVRNPQTDVRLNGYGLSELEELVNTVTSLIWGEDYNKRFFKQGSAPKGILKVSGNVDPAKLQGFKQEWNATMRGVQNAFKTPVLEADKMEWIDLQRTNRDMEFSNWIEFLIKVTSAIFSIDPSEINFPLTGGANQNYMFEGNNEARLKFSKDKGLSPLLKFIQKKINKYIVSQLNPKYEFVFKGIDSTSPKEELELDEKAVKVFKTVNEIRQRRGHDPLEGGDILLESNYTQAMMMAQQEAMGGEDMGGEGYEEPGAEEGEETFEENPIMKAFDEYLHKL